MAKKKARAKRRTPRTARRRDQQTQPGVAPAPAAPADAAAEEDWDDLDEEDWQDDPPPEQLTIDRLWMEILPPDQCGIDPCDGGWSDPTPHWCRQPTQYALCGTYVEFEGPVNSWYYCAQHAEAYAAQAGLPWPPTQHWQ